MHFVFIYYHAYTTVHGPGWPSTGVVFYLRAGRHVQQLLCRRRQRNSKENQRIYKDSEKKCKDNQRKVKENKWKFKENQRKFKEHQRTCKETMLTHGPYIAHKFVWTKFDYVEAFACIDCVVVIASAIIVVIVIVIMLKKLFRPAFYGSWPSLALDMLKFFFRPAFYGSWPSLALDGGLILFTSR